MAEPKTGKDALRRYAQGNAPDGHDTVHGVPSDMTGAGQMYDDSAFESADPTTQGPTAPSTIPTPFKIGGAA